jgi:LysR family glycine cleavage system transcriptional activator
MPLPEGVNPCIRAGSPGQALASALAGMGRTILPLALAEGAVARGALTVLEGPEPARRGYWLLAPPPQWRSKKVRALVGFLSE